MDKNLNLSSLIYVGKKKRFQEDGIYLASLGHIWKGKNFYIFIENKDKLSDFIDDLSKLKIKSIKSLEWEKGNELSEEERNKIIAKIKKVNPI